jgi:hypothetical protein
MSSLITGIGSFLVFVVVPIVAIAALVWGIFALMFSSVSWKPSASGKTGKDGVLSGKHLPRKIIARAGPYSDDER